MDGARRVDGVGGGRRTLEAKSAASSRWAKNSSSYIASMTEMDPATSAQCVSMTLFSDLSAVVWSCTSVSSSIEMRPAAEERPRAGTMEMGPATAMLEPFSLDPSRYLSTPYAYARFHCGEISRRGHPLSYPFSVLNDQADRSRAVGLNWWGTRAR